jgi:hypothetical protein
MKLSHSLIACLALSLLIASALAQDPNVKHYDKDGLSFDYPAKLATERPEHDTDAIPRADARGHCAPC